MLTLQILDILDHPYLRTSVQDPPLLIAPSYDLPDDFPAELDPAVIQDLCFLAYLNQEFFLCETPERIRKRVYGTKRCWEKRWAKMLSAWREKDDMEWQDLNSTGSSAATGKSHSRSFATQTDLV